MFIKNEDKQNNTWQPCMAHTWLSSINLTYSNQTVWGSEKTTLITYTNHFLQNAYSFYNW